MESKIIMLPTEDSLYEGMILLRHLWKNDKKMECRSVWQYKGVEYWNDLEVYQTMDGSFMDVSSSFKKQHLYIVSNLPMIEGDLCYNPRKKNKLGKFEDISDLEDTCYADFGQGTEQCILSDCSKVLYSTDKSLYKSKVEKIKQDFLSEYCKDNGKKENINIENI